MLLFAIPSGKQHGNTEEADKPVNGLCVSLLVTVVVVAVVCGPDYGCDEFSWNLLAAKEISYKARPDRPHASVIRAQKKKLAKGRRIIEEHIWQDRQGTSSLLTRFAGRHCEGSHEQSEIGAAKGGGGQEEKAPLQTLAIGQGF